MLMIPEIRLKNILDGVLLYIKNDYLNTVDKTKTLLYQMFHGVVIEKFDYYTQAIDLFTRGNDVSRKIETRLFFDASRASSPTIHLTLPAENKGPVDGLGVDENYVNYEVDDLGNRTTNYTRSFDTTYRLIITSDNTLEVLLIYHTLRAMLISVFDTLELDGIRNVKMGGMDLQINSDIIPPHIFLRAISLSFFYEVTAPRVSREGVIDALKIQAALSASPKKYIDVELEPEP